MQSSSETEPKSPWWLKVAKGFFLLAVPVMVFQPIQMWQDQAPEFQEVFPTSLITLPLAHLVFRSPYTKLRAWEFPLVLVSICSATAGAFLFTPDGEERQPGFQIFLAAFAALAVSYGFFCSAVTRDSVLRTEVIEPTKTVSRIGLIGFDIGLVLAPFAFLYYLLKHTLGSSR